jgi:hypothetical protein
MITPARSSSPLKWSIRKRAETPYPRNKIELGRFSTVLELFQNGAGLIDSREAGDGVMSR